MILCIFEARIIFVIIPVGKVVKIEEHGTAAPFHSQYFNTDLSPLLCAVTPFKSKQGNPEYHNVEYNFQKDSVLFKPLSVFVIPFLYPIILLFFTIFRKSVEQITTICFHLFNISGLMLDYSEKIYIPSSKIW